MNAIKFLLAILTVGLLFSCNKEDDTTLTGDVEGTWAMTAINYGGVSTTAVAGIETKTTFTGTGFDMDLDINFSENPNTFTQNGDYSIKLESITNGQKMTQDWTNQSFVGDGTWEKSGNKLIITSTGGESQESDILELSNSTMKLAYSITTVQEQQGVTITQEIEGTYTFTR